MKNLTSELDCYVTNDQLSHKRPKKPVLTLYFPRQNYHLAFPIAAIARHVSSMYSAYGTAAAD